MLNNYEAINNVACSNVDAGEQGATTWKQSYFQVSSIIVGDQFAKLPTTYPNSGDWGVLCPQKLESKMSEAVQF